MVLFVCFCILLLLCLHPARLIHFLVEETKDEDDEEEWSPFIPQEPSPILSGIHAKDEGKVWLSMVSICMIIEL